jgi:hypothetical protein
MDAIEPGQLVILHCCNPKEKIWGLLVRLDGVGAVVRGLDLNSVEDWLRQEIAGSEPLIAPSTQFLPVHRVERIFLDESSAAVPGYGDRFRTASGRDPREALAGGDAARTN